ncbi:MAG: TonB family protein [Arenicellales bacterium]
MQENHPAKSSKPTTLLGWFVLLSVLAHGIFLAIPDNKSENKLYVDFASPLQVTVISSRSSPGSKQITATENKPEIIQQAPQQKPVTEIKTTALPLSVKPTGKVDTDNKNSTQSLKPEKNISPRSNSVKSSVHSNNDTEILTDDKTANSATANVKNIPLNHLRQQLKEIIRARFTYPRLARRMGWEGLVGLSLHIEDDGSLNQVRVARSSGHRVLDENARKTIQSIGRLQVASNLTIQAADTEIEVLYRLTD